MSLSSEIVLGIYKVKVNPGYEFEVLNKYFSDPDIESYSFAYLASTFIISGDY